MNERTFCIWKTHPAKRRDLATHDLVFEGDAKACHVFCLGALKGSNNGNSDLRALSVTSSQWTNCRNINRDICRPGRGYQLCDAENASGVATVSGRVPITRPGGRVAVGEGNGWWNATAVEKEESEVDSEEDAFTWKVTGEDKHSGPQTIVCPRSDTDLQPKEGDERWQVIETFESQSPDICAEFGDKGYAYSFLSWIEEEAGSKGFELRRLGGSPRPKVLTPKPVADTHDRQPKLGPWKQSDGWKVVSSARQFIAFKTMSEALDFASRRNFKFPVEPTVRAVKNRNSRTGLRLPTDSTPNDKTKALLDSLDEWVSSS